MSKKNLALRFIVLLGIVSLFGDATYEGYRSIIGPYLLLLGANGFIVGAVSGIGELIGYGIRGISGILSDKTKQYWIFTFVGYVINLLAVPLLALVGSWQMATVLIILERWGKGIRVPARDAMLSYATKHTGRGWGFGLHEALDQIGAVIGPLFVSAFLFFKESYPFTLVLLSIPAALSILTLIFARLNYPRPHEMEVEKMSLQTKGFTRKFWIYLFGVGLSAAGFANFALVSFHFQKSSVISMAMIPFFYAIAMAVDGLSALIMGRIFDRRGISILAIITGITAFATPLLFLGGFAFILIGITLWGIAMGSQESIMRAVIPTLIAPNKRGSAYGILNLVFGLFWSIGGAIMGFFYDFSLLYLVLFSIIMQLMAIPFFLKTKKYQKRIK